MSTPPACPVKTRLHTDKFRQEEWTQELNLPAEEEFLIRRLLCYCYITGYNDSPYDDETDPPSHIQAPAYINRLYLNAQMYSTADKYDLPSLKIKAAEKFDTAVSEIYEQQMTRSLYDGNSLVDQIIEVIPYIYSSTPDGDRLLRSQAVKAVIHGRREFQGHPYLKNLMAAVPEFFREPSIRATELAQSDASSHSLIRRIRAYS